jgi:anti-sigma B factor antagonist
MEIATRTHKGHYLVSLRGELDASSSIGLDDVLHDALGLRPLSIQIDCAELRYISSAGLGVFVSYLQELQTQTIPLVLFSLRPTVENVFQVLGLDTLITILPDGDHAGRHCDAVLSGLAARVTTLNHR